MNPTPHRLDKFRLKVPEEIDAQSITHRCHDIPHSRQVFTQAYHIYTIIAPSEEKPPCAMMTKGRVSNASPKGE